jgi:hypothetical protein
MKRSRKNGHKDKREMREMGVTMTSTTLGVDFETAQRLKAIRLEMSTKMGRTITIAEALNGIMDVFDLFGDLSVNENDNGNDKKESA